MYKTHLEGLLPWLVFFFGSSAAEDEQKKLFVFIWQIDNALKEARYDIRDTEKSKQNHLF